MCHSSFDCIDCSKRFETPADYKGHTSCISEAEKYQKTLYNGEVSERVTTPTTINFTGSQKQSGPERSDRNQRSQQQGGGRQRGNNRPQWQQRNVNKATGANDTPLGTPLRMSPVYDTPVVEEKSQPAVDTLKKRKAEAGTTESKVRLYKFHGLHVLIMNRMPLNRRRRKRSGKILRGSQRRLRPAP